MNSVVDIPLYYFGEIEHKDKKFTVAVAEVPYDEFITGLDLNGHFYPGVINQIYNLVSELGESDNGYIISFIKHYYRSTQTVVFSYEQDSIRKYNDNKITNSIIYNNNPKVVYDAKANIKGSEISFGIYKELEKNSWEHLKKNYFL